MLFVKKKTVLIFGLLIFVMFAIIGCSPSKPDSKKIIEDLKLNSAATQWNESLFDIIDCEIIKSSQNGDYALIYDCNITKKNDECEIIANCKIDYSKTKNGWMLFNYAENSIDVIPLTGISDERVISAVRNIVSGKEANITNIKHNFDKASKTDVVTADFTYETMYYSKSGSAQIKALFDESWNYNANDVSENSQETWKLQPLIGVWQVTCPGDNYTVEFKITNVDQTNNTVIMQCRNAPTGFIAGGKEGSDLINSEKYTTPTQYELQFCKDNKKDSCVYIGTYEFYRDSFDHDYALYFDEDNIYVYDDFYNKKYTVTKVE